MPDAIDFSALHPAPAAAIDWSGLEAKPIDFSALHPAPKYSADALGNVMAPGHFIDNQGNVSDQKTGTASAPAVVREAAQLPTQIGGGLVHALGTMGEAAGTAIKNAPEGAKQTVQNYLDIMDAVDAGQTPQKSATPQEGTDYQNQFAQTYQAANPEQRNAIRKSIEGAQAGMPATEQNFAEAGQAVHGAGESVAQAGTAIVKAGEQAFPLTDEEKQEFSVKAVKMVGNLIPYIGAGAIGGIPGVVGLAGVQGFGDTYDAAKEAGADDEKAAGAGLFGGLANAGLMTVPVGRALEVMNALPGALRGEFMKAVTESVKSGATLTAFSQLSALSDNVIARTTYDPARPLTQGVGENLPETFLAGAVAPVMAAGGAAAARRLFRAFPQATPAETGDAVMHTDNLDDAIQTAQTAVDHAGEAYDIEKEGAEAAQPAENLDRFGGLNTGTIEQDERGGYQFRTAQGDAVPLVPWEPQHGPVADENVISPELAIAQRQHYEGLGLHVVYFQNDPAIPFDGAVDPNQPDTIFLSNNPTRNAAQIGAHEITHVLESTTLPDGSNLGDLLHQQIKEGVTEEGLRYANQLFGATAPERTSFPEGQEGDSLHADAVTNHLITELGADIGGEAPRFASFTGKVVEAVQNRFGPNVAKDVLGRFIVGIRTAMDTVRKFFGATDDPEAKTVSQNWVTNLDQVHNTLAQMYAAKYGTQLEKEQAVVEAMRRQAQQPPEMDFSGLHPPREKAPPRPMDLLEFLARNGGLQDQGGELRAMEAQKKFVPGAGMLVRRMGGKTLDYAREAALEAGYPVGEDIASFVDAVRDNLTGQSIYSDRDTTEADAWRDYQLRQRGLDRRASGADADDIEQRAHQLGIEVRPEWSPEDTLAAIYEREGMMAEGEALEPLADDIEQDILGRVAYNFTDARDDLPTETGAQPEGARPATAAGNGPEAAIGEAARGAGAAQKPEGGGAAARAGAPTDITRFSPKGEEETKRDLEAAGQTILPGATHETPEQINARQRQRDKEAAEAQMRGGKTATKPQQPIRETTGFGDQTDLFGGGKKPAQGTLFSPKDRRFLGGGDVDKGPPEDISYRDEVSDLIGAATGKTGESGQPENRGGRGGTSGPTISERDYNNLVAKGLRQVKNAGAFESNTFFGWLFPRTLAALDDLSATFWRSWEGRDDKGRANAEELKRIISPSLTELPQESRDRVYAALELARKWNWRPPDDGRLIRVKNTSYWQAQKSKIGDDYTLTPEETKAVHDTMKLGDEGWRMFMRALAQREGWEGSLDPEAIRSAANGDKRLLRLADALGQAKLALGKPYFPAARHGDYFVAVYPKSGTDTESLGGYPKVEWFQTIENASLREVMGRPRKMAADVDGVKDAIANLKSLKKPDGSLAFPEDQYRIEVGDLRTRPGALRRLDIPAIEKLFMLMERKVTQSTADSIIASGEEETDKAARETAKLRYQQLFGETKEALLDAVYQDLLSGFKKHAALTPGYDADFDRAIASHIQQVGRNAADMQFRPQIDDAYQAIQDNHPHSGTRDYWRDWRRYQEDPAGFLSRAAGGINQYGAAYVMAMNPASTVSIMLHTPLMAAPVLSVGGGMGQASAQIARGLREAYANIKFGKDGAYIDTSGLGRTAAEKAFLAELDKIGLLHSLGAADLRSVSETQSGLFGENAPIVRRGLNIAMSNISVADQANRSAIALAAFRMAQSPDRLEKMAGPWMEHNALFRDMVVKEGLTPENFGRFMLAEAVGSWGKMNQAPAMRGAEGHLLFAMHGFQTRFLSTALKLAKNMGPEGKMAVAWMGLGLFAATGLYGLPFTQDLENAAGVVWKKLTGEDPMIDASVRAFLNDSGFAKIGTEIMMRGPASVLLGTDLASRIGFGDILTRDVSASDLVGTIPSIVWSRLNAAWNREQSGQGATTAAVEFLPNALRVPARAYIDQQQGILSQGGKMQTTAENLSAGDIAMQSAGFTPLKQEQAFARNDYLSRLEGRDRELHERIVSTVANLATEAQEASEKGDGQRAASLTVQLESTVEDYNKAHYQTPVTGEELGDALLQRKNPDLYKRLKLPELLQPEAQANPYP